MALVFLSGSMAILGEGEILGGVVMGSIGVGVPLLIGALMVRRVRLKLDRTTGRITRKSRSVAGLTEVTFALDRLKHAQVGVSTDSDGSTCRIELKLRGPDEIVPFTNYYTGGRKPERLCSTVNAWLGVASAG